MPHFEATTTVRRPLTEVFDFLSRPANLIELTPPEFMHTWVTVERVEDIIPALYIQGSQEIDTRKVRKLT